MSTVPRLVGNDTLSYAIHALSNHQRYIERHHRNISDTELSDVARRCHRRSLRCAKKILHFATYQKSQELMVTALILSTYEMLRDDREAWRRNLQGVSCILRSRDTDPESPGLESAVWWAWLRQEVWAAFRDGCRVDSNTWALPRRHARGSTKVSSWRTQCGSWGRWSTFALVARTRERRAPCRRECGRRIN
ncbi:hypothetical protein IMZ48_18125 [Candidatus Bathyarchaeota archaeon]|nr:hypothetical protein [Candidatus Bathyarchaeota archaeon]